ncbi:MAG: YaaA family protein [Acholeplasmataceae bacterium]|nr:YaaA family protein [Acholeplasmataceae bacterium]
MIIILSPAKTFASHDFPFDTEPLYLKEATILIKKLNKFSFKSLEKSMKISADLAKKVKANYQTFNQEPYCALFSYDGHAFRSFNAQTLTKDSLDYVKDHLIILSGLYGIVRPCDGITPYRLDIKDQTVVNLYKYWKDIINNYLKSIDPNELIINLASHEYSKMIEANINMVTITFAYDKNAKKRINNMELKHLRGAMARYIIDHRVQSRQALKSIVFEGYSFSESLSNHNELIFIKEVSQ